MPRHFPTLTCCAQDFLEQLVTLGLGTVQQENLFLFGKDIVSVHLTSQRADCRQLFQVRQLVPKSTDLPRDVPLSKSPPSRGNVGSLPHGEHLTYRAPPCKVLKPWQHKGWDGPLQGGERGGGCPLHVQQ